MLLIYLLGLSSLPVGLLIGIGIDRLSDSVVINNRFHQIFIPTSIITLLLLSFFLFDKIKTLPL